MNDPARTTLPTWFAELLGRRVLADGDRVEARGEAFVVHAGVLRAAGLTAASAAQDQTSRTFGFKWHKRDTFDRAESRARMRTWLLERYGALTEAPWFARLTAPVIVDAGCGAALTALELLGPALPRARYVGLDISLAVDVARERLAGHGDQAFVQCDLGRTPLPEGCADLILSEGVLHHTDSTEAALKGLVPLLRPGGRFAFYVYRKKGPVREFTDDHVRDALQAMTPEEAWDAMMGLTRLGKALGDLGAKVTIPVDVPLLGIPAGEYDVQRLWYWHVCKAFHHPDLTLDELNHINFDWFAPRNAHRQTPEDVRRWCADAGLAIEREDVQESGITIVARRT